jgi:murein DD-endopeptidase MepM/ murein hydrolase activator NlpD
MVVAARSGRVWSTRESSRAGCDSPDCSSLSNHVIVDHGDGSYAEYQHLSHRGALVEAGDVVCRGQAIALCGRTGYTTGAHLHFAVLDTTGHSVPPAFEDIDGPRGFPVPQGAYVSDNDRRVGCLPAPYSTISRLGFAHQGIVLDQEVPLVESAPTRRITGRYRGPLTQVALHRRRVDGSVGSWTEECVEVDEEGRFEVVVDWRGYGRGEYWLMLTGAGEGCEEPSWSWSYRLRLEREASGPPAGADGRRDREEPRAP